jgi:hypothetical protein
VYRERANKNQLVRHCVGSTRPNVPTQHILKETDVGSADGDADSEAGAMLLQAFEHVVPGVQYALQTYPTDEQVVTVWRLCHCLMGR